MEQKIDEYEINEALKKVLDIVEMEQERDFVSNAQLFDFLVTAYSIDSNLIPTSVASDYVGVHLGQYYEDNDFLLMLNSLENDQFLDPFYALKIINDAKESFLKLPNIQVCKIESSSEAGCIIVGDLHGHFNDLVHIIRKFGIPGGEYKFIFNGDFVDRGPKQVQVLLTILYAFLIRPDRVFLNRGNHESININSSPNFRPNFISSCRQMYGKYGSTIFKSANDLFTALPLATRLENVVTNSNYFIVHGGISDDLKLDQVEQIDRSRYENIQILQTKYKNESKIVCDMLWSDPIREEDGIIMPRSAPSLKGCHKNKLRNIGCYFGFDVTDNFCKKNSFKAIIRSHEPRANGFSQDHSKCFTIFSASNYCGCKNSGAVLRLLAEGTSFEGYSFKNSEVESSTEVTMGNNYLLKQFKRLIMAREEEMMKKFSAFDYNSTGMIQTDNWAEIISKSFNSEISEKHLKLIKDLLCECEDTIDCVNYKSLFCRDTTTSSEDEKYLSIVTNLFELLDQNNDQQISASEARNALIHLNQKLGTKFSVQDDCFNFINQMDINGDNLIDLEEFKIALIGERRLNKSYNESGICIKFKTIRKNTP